LEGGWGVGGGAGGGVGTGGGGRGCGWAEVREEGGVGEGTRLGEEGEGLKKDERGEGRGVARGREGRLARGRAGGRVRRREERQRGHTQRMVKKRTRRSDGIWHSSDPGVVVPAGGGGVVRELIAKGTGQASACNIAGPPEMVLMR